MRWWFQGESCPICDLKGIENRTLLLLLLSWGALRNSGSHPRSQRECWGVPQGEPWDGKGGASETAGICDRIGQGQPRRAPPCFPTWWLSQQARGHKGPLHRGSLHPWCQLEDRPPRCSWQWSWELRAAGSGALREVYLITCAIYAFQDHHSIATYTRLSSPLKLDNSEKPTFTFLFVDLIPRTPLSLWDSDHWSHYQNTNT